MAEKMIFESPELITFVSEDSGRALIVDCGEPEKVDEADKDSGMWVRIGSWDDLRIHSDIRSLEGKRVRVTLEVID